MAALPARAALALRSHHGLFLWLRSDRSARPRTLPKNDSAATFWQFVAGGTAVPPSAGRKRVKGKDPGDRTRPAYPALTSLSHTLQSVSMSCRGRGKPLEGSLPQSGPLSPSLWRTCRVLANRTRLRLLSTLLDEPDQTVSAVAHKAGVPLAVASLYLRALNARGLLGARRQGRWVYYRPSSDRSIHGSAVLLAALERAFADERNPVEAVFRHATAFTHARRIRLIQTMTSGPQTPGAMQRATRFSRPALLRHLAKLKARGYVVRDSGGYGLARPQGRLAATLLALAAAQPHARNGKGGRK